MTRWMLAAAACLGAAPIQEPGPDRVFILGEDPAAGEIVGIEADGSLVLKSSGRPRVVPLENVSRIQFEEKPQAAPDKFGSKLWPRFGGALTGSLVSISADRVTFKCAHGSYALRREDVRAISIGKVPAEPKEVREDQDLLFLEPEKKGEAATVSGRIELLDATSVQAGGAEYDRSRVLEIRFGRGSAPEPAAGLFARVLMKNGDGFVGMLRKVEPGRVHLFTHYAGAVSLEKAAIHSIAFVPMARIQFGHLLVCEPAGVREVDRWGSTVWTYGEGAVGCSSARKLPNGNVLIANSHRGQVFEVRPTGPAGGQVIWSMEELAGPHDAQRLPSGHVLVAESGAGRVAEYDPRDKSLKWSARVQAPPTSVERLEDGGTLVSMNTGQALELDAQGRLKFRYAVANVNECRATRTPAGTTLIADQRGTQVVEVDAQSAVLWKYDLPQPRMAIRFDDGTTMILKRNGEIVGIDERGQVVRTYGRFESATAFSVY